MTRSAALARLPVVAFDETGNTGQALLDPAQPIFALASVHLDDGAATQALALIKASNAREAKFSTLRTSGPGRRRVLSLLREPWMNASRIKAVFYHKPFMVTTKVVDMLLEPLALRGGVDLYANGANLATANLLHMAGPVFCGADAYAEMLRRFVEMVRKTDEATVSAFYAHVDAMRRGCTDSTLGAILSSIRFTSSMLDECLSPGDVTALDPAIPTFVDLAAQWTADLGRSFSIVHDHSKPIQEKQKPLELLMTTAERGPDHTGPGPRRQMPILSSGIQFLESHTVPQLQIADVIAGAVATVFRAAATRTPDKFAAQLRDETRLLEVVTEAIWPTTAMGPDEYGHGRSSASLHYTIELAARERERRGT